ncbi:MAG: twin-arginine translocation signal domain-containing protein [Planctomycetota bacterium]|nr:MAG: twin-arginine translocation signal domain-containing protein [Planctomycetota bacterium]
MKCSRRSFLKASAASAALAMIGLPFESLAEDGIRYTRSQCRFCGTGCSVLVGTKKNKVISIKGDPKSPINEGRVCIKGYNLPHILYGKDRLTKPLVRQKDGKYKEVSWDEALDLIASKFLEYIKKYGKDSVAWYGSGQNTTQEAFAANKLFKGIIGTANVEGNPRLCMASAVGGYLNTFGADEPAGSYDDLNDADCFFIIGSNMAEQHPMLFRRVVNRKEAYPDRVKIIVADPRKTPTARYADLFLQFKPGYDTFLLNSMAYVIVEENLIDREHLKYCTFRKGLKTKGEFTNLYEYKKFLNDYAPERVEDKVGVSAKDIRTAARWFGRKGMNTLSLWTMGLNQRTKGVHLNCQVHNLHLLTGKIGKPGCDSMSLTGQPNACGGTREQGGLSHILPGHRAVANPKHRKEIADIWGVPVEWLPTKPTGPAVNMFMRLAKGDIKAIWINTTNPGQSLPNLNLYRKAMRNAFTVVSDVYPTATTELASVILPSAMWVEKEGVMGQTDRRSQFIPKLVDPPGEARADFWQIKELAKRIAKGLGRKTKYRVIDPMTGKVKAIKEVYGLGFETEEEAWNEYRLCTKGQDVDLWGATYEKLKAHSGGIQWPCPSTEFENLGSAKRYISKEYALQVFGKTKIQRNKGYVTLYDQHLEEEKLSGPINYYGGHPFHKGSKGKAIIRVLPAGLDYEMPDKEYPFVLNTGRVIEHWHSGTMTMRVEMLRQQVPYAYVEISPMDARRLGIKNGNKVKLQSRRGEIILPAWVTDRAQEGMVFVPWFDERKLINLLTVDAPKSWSGAGEPDYKVCAIKVEKVS